MRQHRNWSAGVTEGGDPTGTGDLNYDPVPVTDQEAAEEIVHALIGGHVVEAEDQEMGIWLVTVPEIVEIELTTEGDLGCKGIIVGRDGFAVEIEIP